MRTLVHAIGVLAFLSLSPLLWGQSTQGSILGTVMDPSGAVIPGVGVEIRNQETNRVRETITNDSGFYLAERLEPGVYTVTAKLPGFKEYVRPGVVLATNGQVRIEIKLEMGELSQQTTVESASPVIETDTARIAALRDRVMTVNAAVSRPGAGFTLLMTTPAAFYTGTGYSMHGSRGTGGSYTLDGVATGNPVNGSQNSEMWVDLEATMEFRVSGVNNSAEYASSAVMNQTTMSGTNAFHGQVSWIHGNGAVFARPFFSASRPTNRENWFYGSVGGPVVLPKYNGRNKTFFFLHTDEKRAPALTTYISDVPTDSMRAGDFSSFTRALIDPTTGQQFLGNKIPTGRLNANALKYLDRFYPRANRGNPLVASQNHYFDVINDRQDTAWMFRLDHNISNRLSLTYRYFSYDSIFLRPDGELPLEYIGYYIRQRTNWSHAFTSTYSFSPTVVNELRVGYMRINWPSGTPANGKSIVESIGLTGYPQALEPRVGGAPTVSISGLKGISIFSEGRNIQNLWDVNDSFTFMRGSHAFKTGISVRHAHITGFPVSPSAQFGSFSFDGFATGHAFGDFLLGLPRTASRSSSVPPYYGRYNAFAVFFQDDWKIRRTLTLNLGVRYELNAPFAEERDRIVSFDPASGSLVVPNSNSLQYVHPLFPKDIPFKTASQVGFAERTLIANDVNNIAPRVGFAWRTGLSDLVIRGGYGIFYTAEARKGFTNQLTGPFVASETFDNSIVNRVPLFAWPQAFPTTGAARPLGIQSVSVVLSGLPDSYVHQYNLTLEKQIGANGVRLSYIGSSAIQLPYRRDLNQPAPSTVAFSQSRRPYPIYRNITLMDAGGTQSYNSFQAGFVRRLTKGFSVDSHYTWAKNLTDTHDTSALGGSALNAYDRRAERSNEQFTPRHRWMTMFVWELPVGKGRPYLKTSSGWVEALIGNWTMSGLGAIATGGWYTVTYSGVDSSNTNVTSGRPDRLGDGSLSGSQRTWDKWYDYGSFIIPKAGIGRFGNAAPNIIEGPGQSGLNLRVFKSFSITERVRVKLDFWFGNILNHPMLGFAEGNPGLNLSSASVGKVTANSSTQIGIDPSSRNIRAGLKIEF